MEMKKRGEVFVATVRVGFKNNVWRSALIDTGCTRGVIIPFSLYRKLRLVETHILKATIANETDINLLVCITPVLIDHNIKVEIVYVLPKTEDIAKRAFPSREAEHNFFDSYDDAMEASQTFPRLLVGTEVFTNQKLTLEFREDGEAVLCKPKENMGTRFKAFWTRTFKG